MRDGAVGAQKVPRERGQLHAAPGRYDVDVRDIGHPRLAHLRRRHDAGADTPTNLRLRPISGQILSRLSGGYLAGKLRRRPASVANQTRHLSTVSRRNGGVVSVIVVVVGVVAVFSPSAVDRKRVDQRRAFVVAVVVFQPLRLRAAVESIGDVDSAADGQHRRVERIRAADLETHHDRHRRRRHTAGSRLRRRPNGQMHPFGKGRLGGLTVEVVRSFEKKNYPGRSGFLENSKLDQT